MATKKPYFKFVVGDPPRDLSRGGGVSVDLRFARGRIKIVLDSRVQPPPKPPVIAGWAALLGWIDAWMRSHPEGGWMLTEPGDYTLQDALVACSK